MPTPLGQLSREIDPEVVMMICTAGHVDHGKTRLVGMLTGCETDRLKEEKERGLTIELGFAPCWLGGKLCVGIVDVPGHEKFVKNMVAGVSGIGLCVLVIAADDGVMPQTVEHVQIMELLGVRRGMVALTKTDLVSPQDVELRQQEIGEFLKSTFLEGAAICPVSSETGEGFSEFYDTLVATIKRVAAARRLGVFRMPIERTFAQEGFGSVISGIPVDGVIRAGDQVELVPGGQTGRIRGIQRFGRDATEGGYGQCLALNVPDLSKTPPQRGQVLCLPGYLRAAQFFHVNLHAVPGLERPVTNAEQIKFHTGTIEEPGKIFLLEDKALGAGQSALATVALSRAVAAAAHDRFIIRRPSPAETVAGGEIIDITYGDNRPRRAQIIVRLARLREAFVGVDPDSPEGAAKRIEAHLNGDLRTGGSLKDISMATLLPPAAVKEAVQRMIASKAVLALHGDYFVHAGAYRDILATTEARIKKAAEEEKALSLPISQLQQELGLPAPLWNHVRPEIEKRAGVVAQGGKLVLKAAAGRMDPADQRLMEAIYAVYEKGGYQTPRPDELPDLLKSPAAKINRLLDHLCNERRLIRLSKIVLITGDNYKKAQDVVVATIKQKGTLNSGDFKTVIASSRKYALAFLDYLDARRVTMRLGNDRKLTPDYQKYLL